MSLKPFLSQISTDRFPSISEVIADLIKKEKEET